ncbi:MAG: hypothetical protein JWM16_1557 [Verrucomicrobiales bacterium]|nr:hypothetical protein [Verrucomicrobiales bacterium]
MAFDPRGLKYSSDGIPYLKKAELEDVAHEVLAKHCPSVFEKPSFTPVLDIIGGLMATTPLKHAIEELGYNGKAKILGKVSFHLKSLFLDIALTHERKIQFRFTAAHEIGHWILHRYNYKNWRLEGKKVNADHLEDDEDSLCRLEEKSPLDWLEWQANVFASALVMPKEPFIYALVKNQKTLGIDKNLGLVFVSNNQKSNLDYQNILTSLSSLFDVSKQSVRVRLHALGMLQDERTTAFKSARQALSTGEI